MAEVKILKSVTIKNQRGKLLIKILHRKNGEIEVTRISDYESLDIEVRDDDGCKVLMGVRK